MPAYVCPSPSHQGGTFDFDIAHWKMGLMSYWYLKCTMYVLIQMYKKCRRRPYQLLWVGNCKHKGWKDNVCTGHKTVSRDGSSLYWIWLCAHFLFREHESVFYIALDQDVTYVFSKRSPAETLNLSGSTNLGLKLQCF